MVWEFKSLNIVMLCGLDEVVVWPCVLCHVCVIASLDQQDRVVQYWPMRPGETLMYGKMAVTLTDNPGVSPKDQITKYKLELKEEKVRVQVYILFLTSSHWCNPFPLHLLTLTHLLDPSSM